MFAPTIAALARTACYGLFPAESPFFVEVAIMKRDKIACSASLKVGRSLYNVYHKGIPVQNYPPPPNGVPGSEGTPFHLCTPVGRFACRMLAAGQRLHSRPLPARQVVVKIYDHRDCCATAGDGQGTAQSSARRRYPLR